MARKRGIHLSERYRRCDVVCARVRVCVCACVQCSVIESSGGWAYYDFSIGTSRLCDERDLMVDPLKLFWVITNSTYLGRSLSSLRCATEIFEKEGDLGGEIGGRVSDFGHR